MNSNSLAKDDILRGLAQWRIWAMLGWQDIEQRYRRTTLGPLWLTVTMFVMIGSLGFVFSTVLGQDMSTYLPFIAAGLVTWSLISQTLAELPSAFVSTHTIIQSLNLPFTVHVIRILVRQFAMFFHSLVAFLVIAAIYGVDLTLATLLVFPGMILLFANGIWLGLLLGTLGARYRDLGPTVSTLLQIFFFVTPIVWTPQSVSHRPYITDLNPMFHILEMVRSPLLGNSPSWLSYYVVIGILIMGSIFTYQFFLRFRRRISYWL